jgi:pyridoxamine 5'-phosphate oxidase
MPDIFEIRDEYGLGSMDEADVPDNPFQLFGSWFELARSGNEPLFNAMVLSTVGANGQPSSRVVLLKHFDEHGFVFFTNYQSRKGLEMSSEPKVSLLFHWTGLQKQVRIEGRVEKTPAGFSDKYFYQRPVESQVSAIVSDQSHIVPNRQYLENAYGAFQSSGKKIQRPAHWGGYVTKPSYFEFWQGRTNRLHDRFAFLKEDGLWKKNRLAP